MSVVFVVVGGVYGSQLLVAIDDGILPVHWLLVTCCRMEEKKWGRKKDDMQFLFQSTMLHCNTDIHVATLLTRRWFNLSRVGDHTHTQENEMMFVDNAYQLVMIHVLCCRWYGNVLLSRNWEWITF